MRLPKITDFTSQDPEVLSGALAFKGTRVHVKTLFDFIAEGDSIDEFLLNFPSVSSNQVFGVLSACGYDLPREQRQAA